MDWGMRIMTCVHAEPQDTQEAMERLILAEYANQRLA